MNFEQIFGNPAREVILGRTIGTIVSSVKNQLREHVRIITTMQYTLADDAIHPDYSWHPHWRVC